ncbi:hypothetical protein N8D55_16840 [Xanthomonas hortorum pv. pelargonii]|nr:hypothetical protein N8D55_16840 [Xanthomonas hortorum pv. pelargonii]
MWAVSGAEAASVGLIHQPDPVVGNPAHAIINFNAVTEKECRKLAKKLKKFAVDRGSQYRAA